MEHHRYGTFHPTDYITSWCGIAILLIFAIVSYILNLSLVFVCLPSAYAVIWLWAVAAPNLERFTICGDYITAKKGKKVRKISIPSEVTLLISYVDICPPLTIRTSVGNRTHILKNKYAVTILERMPLELILERLHRNNIRKYTTSIIRTVFDEHQFIYSFVCDEKLLTKALQDRKCLLIIPKTLVDNVRANLSAVDVYVDSSC